MEKTYSISLDGGGSKIQALLFDNDYNGISYSVAKGLNPTVNTAEAIREHIGECIDKLFADFVPPKIEGIYGSFFSQQAVIGEMISNYCPHGEFFPLSEGYLGALSAGIIDNAVVALSGTGSDIFVIKDGKNGGAMGGYGYLLGDEGSGFYLGQSGLRAALHSQDGLKGDTLLTTLINERLGTGDLKSGMFSLYSSKNPPAIIASLARAVGEAAYASDRTALELVRRNGRLMAQQAAATIVRFKVPHDVPVCIIGGCYKVHPAMLETFAKVLRASIPNAKIKLPIFEPVVAGILYSAVSSGEHIDDAFIERLKSNFPNELYQFPFEPKI